LATSVGGFFQFKPSEQCLLVADFVAKVGDAKSAAIASMY
jgi:hypothetical protein